MLIDLPLPHKLLHPNGSTRSHMARARHIKKARGDAKLAGIAARYDANQKQPWKRATLAATFYVKHHQSMDEDGLIAWLKPYRDGLADAGIVENDRGFTNAKPVLVKGAKHPRVEIVMTELTEPLAQPPAPDHCQVCGYELEPDLTHECPPGFLEREGLK